MGFFGKLFGGGGSGARRPPSWAKGWSDGARFDAFAQAVADVLEAEGFPISADDARTGSVMIEDEHGKRHEWIFHSVAEECAKAEPDAWPAMLREDLHGDGENEAPAPTPAKKAWIIGTAPWGGVLLECGASEMLLILLPISDAAPLAALPDFPPGLIRAIVVCNAGDEGHLRATAVMRAAKLIGVHAIDPARPVDRGAGSGVTALSLRPFTSLGQGALRAERRGASVLATWDDGTTALVGDAVPFSLIGETVPDNVVGKLVKDDFEPAALVTWLARARDVTLFANVPGLDAGQLATALSTMGVGCTVVNRELAAPAAPAEPRRLRVLAHVMMGDLDQADALAREAIAAGDEVADMHHQRAMIALMRGDEAAAAASLAQIDTPQAMNSRALLLAKQGDPGARDLARRAVERLPGDAIAIRGAIQVHVVTGDRDGARALLAAHGAHLGADIRAALGAAIDGPAAFGAHRFPELAQLALDAVKPMLDERRFADAEPLLRRAAAWDPENLGITAELGFALSQQQRDADAIAIYDEAIARGGAATLLRYNRANCRLRTQRYADAAADLRACLEVKPDWHEARINLVSACFADGKTSDARAELAALRRHGGPAQHIRSLEKMLAGTL